MAIVNIMGLLADGTAPERLKAQIMDLIGGAVREIPRIPAGGERGEVLAREAGGALAWRTVRDGAPGRDGVNGRGIVSITPEPGGDRLQVNFSDGSATSVPAKVEMPISDAALAKALGVAFHVGAEPPTEETKNGVPVVWLRSTSFTTPTWVAPYRPAPNFGRRTITIPEQAGLSWKVDGAAVQPGVFSVPNNNHQNVTVTAEALPGFQLARPAKWVFTFGTITDRVLVASDVFAGRNGEFLVPQIEESKRAEFSKWAIRYGSVWNNAAGGTATIRWNQNGTGVENVGGVDKLNGWRIDKTGAAVGIGSGNLEDALVFNPGTPNISLEFEVSEVLEDAIMTTMFGQSRELKNSEDGTECNIFFSKNGTSSMQEKNGATAVSNLNAGNPVGVWRIDFLDGVITITSPSGVRATQDNSPLDERKYGKFSKFRISKANAVKFKSVMLYMSTNG